MLGDTASRSAASRVVGEAVFVGVIRSARLAWCALRILRTSGEMARSGEEQDAMTILLLRVLWMKLTEEKKLHAFDISGRGKKGHTDGQKDRVPRGEPDVQANDSWSLTAGHVLQH